MLQGECDIQTDGGSLKLRAGQTLYIPVGERHELTNNGWEPAVYVCSFSHSGRGTLFRGTGRSWLEPARPYGLLGNRRATVGSTLVPPCSRSSRRARQSRP